MRNQFASTWWHPGAQMGMDASRVTAPYPPCPAANFSHNPSNFYRVQHEVVLQLFLPGLLIEIRVVVRYSQGRAFDPLDLRNYVDFIVKRSGSKKVC